MAKVLKKKKKIISKKATKKALPKKRVKKILKKKVVKSKKKILKKVTKKPVTKKSIKKVSKKKSSIKLKKSTRNPIMGPTPYPWESMAVFNPGAVVLGGRVHLFYRALGADGVSRIGYATSIDGINFDVRLSYPVFIAQNYEEASRHWPHTSPARLEYNTYLYASGGGWGGCEDPRVVVIDGVIYMTFNMFNGWNSMRVGVTSIREEDLLKKKWLWKNFSYLSRPGDRQKNWMLFPEKFNGKFALFHNLDKGDPNRVHIAYMNELGMAEAPMGAQAPDPQMLPDHVVAWHNRTRSAACPPIKTKDGWLLLYHAMDKDDGGRYKVGAMLLDLKNPEKVLYRAQEPILEPDMWYENEWKAGVVYASGAVVLEGKLMVYYGGGDKYIGLASIELSELLESLKKNKAVKLSKQKVLTVN